MSSTGPGDKRKQDGAGRNSEVSNRPQKSAATDVAAGSRANDARVNQPAGAPQVPVTVGLMDPPAVRLFDPREVEKKEVPGPSNRETSYPTGAYFCTPTASLSQKKENAAVVRHARAADNDAAPNLIPRIAVAVKVKENKSQLCFDARQVNAELKELLEKSGLPSLAAGLSANRFTTIKEVAALGSDNDSFKELVLVLNLDLRDKAMFKKMVKDLQ
eukprot:1997426-Rhodomonas_salina.2